MLYFIYGIIVDDVSPQECSSNIIVRLAYDTSKLFVLALKIDCIAIQTFLATCIIELTDAFTQICIDHHKYNMSPDTIKLITHN